MSRIEVRVRLGENTSDVLTEVIAKVNEAKFELPREVEDSVISTATGNDELMYMAFLSDQMSVQQIHDYVSREVQPELSTIEGVGEAKIMGDRVFAMRIWLNPTEMAAFGVTAIDVDEAVREENFISAAGTTRGALVRASVDAETDMQSPEAFGNIVVRQDGERRVRLSDVAELELASANYDSAAYSSGRDTVFLSIAAGARRQSPRREPRASRRHFRASRADAG